VSQVLSESGQKLIRIEIYKIFSTQSGPILTTLLIIDMYNNFHDTPNLDFYLLIITSAIRAFGLGYFQYSAPVPEPRHIRVRQKGVTFGPGCQPKQKHPFSTSGMVEPKPYTWNVTTNREMPLEFNL